MAAAARRTLPRRLSGARAANKRRGLVIAAAEFARLCHSRADLRRPFPQSAVPALLRAAGPEARGRPGLDPRHVADRRNPRFLLPANPNARICWHDGCTARDAWRIRCTTTNRRM